MRYIGLVLVLGACNSSSSSTRGDAASAEGPTAGAYVGVSHDAASASDAASPAITAHDLGDASIELDLASPPDLATPPDLAPPDPNLPFPTPYCSGAGASEAQLAALFQPGTSEADFGAYAISGKTRTCTAVTGCSAWSDWTPSFYTAISPVSPFVDEPRLLVEGSAIELELVNQFCTASNAYAGEWYGSTCSIGSAGQLTCSTYEWDAGQQWGGSGGTFCTPEELYLGETGSGYTLTGTITPGCFEAQTQQGPAVGTQYAIDIHGTL